MSRSLATLDAAVYRVGRRPRNTPFQCRYATYITSRVMPRGLKPTATIGCRSATAANPSSSTLQCACGKATKVPLHPPSPSNSKLNAVRANTAQRRKLQMPGLRTAGHRTKPADATRGSAVGDHTGVTHKSASNLPGCANPRGRRSWQTQRVSAGRIHFDPSIYNLHPCPRGG